MKNASLKTCDCFDVVHRVCTHIAVAMLFVCLVENSASAQLVHPGGWHTQEDLTTIRENVAAEVEPWISGWNAARNEGPDAARSQIGDLGNFLWSSSWSKSQLQSLLLGCFFGSDQNGT